MDAALPVSARCCIIGHPVDQSLSPAIHNAAYEATGLDWQYERIDVEPRDLADAVARLRADGYAGVNVTIPHKQTVIELLDEIAGDAGVFGAVNTITRSGDRLVGDNTDGAGFMRFLRSEAAFEPAGQAALVLGAGGSARAVAIALAREGARVTVAARRPEQATRIARTWQSVRTVDLADAAAIEAGLIVNCTPARAGLPVTPERARLVVDLVYQGAVTELVARARAAGVEAFDGLGMLVHQAALSFEIWTKRPAPIEAMWTAAREAGTGLPA